MSNTKLFADDTSIFLVIKDVAVTTKEMNEDFFKKEKIPIPVENKLHPFA